MVTINIKEYDQDGDLLFSMNKSFPALDVAAEYATEYHKGRIAYPGGSYQLTFIRK